MHMVDQQPPAAQPGPPSGPPGQPGQQGSPGQWAPPPGPPPGQFRGPPGYYQAGYGPGGYGPGYARRPTNTMAILSLVMAFVFAPLGIVFGVIARRQIRQTGEDGDSLAVAGLWVSIAFTAVFAVMIVAWIVMFVALLRRTAVAV
jgi:hypothetical protein